MSDHIIGLTFRFVVNQIPPSKDAGQRLGTGRIIPSSSTRSSAGGRGRSRSPKSDRSGGGGGDRRPDGSRALRTADKQLFDGLLRDLTSERASIRGAMGFALDHSDESNHIVDLLTESICSVNETIPKRIARLFLCSDILYNSSAPVRNASSYRTLFQSQLNRIFESLHTTYAAIDGRITANAMKEKVTTVVRVWQAWSLFPVSLLTHIEDVFLGKPTTPYIAPSVTTLPLTTTPNPATRQTAASRSAYKPIHSTAVPATSTAPHSTATPAVGLPPAAAAVFAALNAVAAARSVTPPPNTDAEELDGVPLGTPLIAKPAASGPPIVAAAAVNAVADDDIDGAPLNATAAVPAPPPAKPAATATAAVAADDDDIDGVPMQR